MKTIATLLTATVLATASFGAFAQSVTATAATLSSAEKIIAQKACEQHASGYTITSARMGNYVTMSAKLTK